MLVGVDQTTDELADVLFSGGCADRIPFSAGGMAGIGFSREVGSLEESVRTVIADVTRAGFLVGRVEPADAPVFAQINRELAIY